jgi:hypothetical protein
MGFRRPALTNAAVNSATSCFCRAFVLRSSDSRSAGGFRVQPPDESKGWWEIVLVASYAEGSAWHFRFLENGNQTLDHEVPMNLYVTCMPASYGARRELTAL